MASSATTNNSSSSSSSSMSPRRTSENHGNNNPIAAATAQPRRQSRPGSSPWSQIVRGESEPIAAAPSSPQSRAPIEPIASVSVAPPASVLTVEAAAAVTGGGDERSEESGNAGKRPVWKRPSNGSSSEVGPVMGASSWPALSETTKVPSNKSSSDSLKSLDVASSSSSSVPVSQGVANVSVPAAAPKQASRANPNPTPNHSRQKSFKRNGASGSGSASNGSVSQPSGQGSFADMPSHNPSPRGQNQKNGFASQNHGGTDNLSQRDSYRNQNDNHHQNHGGRRNQEHGNQNWTPHRNFNGRDGNAQSQRGGAPAFVRHAPPPVQPIPPQFMAAQPIPPFGSPVPFPPELASQYYPRMPFIAPLGVGPAPVFYHVQDPPLNMKLQKQIHYYFSEENLIRDTFLRGHMDDQGFAPLRVIANFKKVAELTDSIQTIVDALQGSPYVEVQGDRIRKRYNWQQWVLPRVPDPAVSSPQSVERADAVASQVGNLSLGESSAGPIGGSSSQLQPENQAVSDGQGQSSSGVDPVSNHNDSDGANR